MNQVVRLANYAQRRIGSMFPAFFPGANVKHDYYKDFGWPETLTFDQLYRMYLRNGVATAGVDKTALKTWQDIPFLLEQERDGSESGPQKETTLERDIRKKFAALRLWAKLADADRMAMVGGYSGVILRLRDGNAFDQPVDRVPGGLDGLYKLDPVWKGQLTVADYDTDPRSETYGEPVMYQFNEAALSGDQKQNRQLRIHPDRVLIWSDDGSIYGRSILEPGFNDLVDMDKVKGAGGEGFWKNAKSAPVLEVDKEAKIADMAKAMGVTVGELADKMNDQVADYNAGFDQLLMLMGMQAKQLNVTLPSPEHFYGVALNSFAASINMPVKILVGMQTGERASQEDKTRTSGRRPACRVGRTSRIRTSWSLYPACSASASCRRRTGTSTRPTSPRHPWARRSIAPSRWPTSTRRPGPASGYSPPRISAPRSATSH
ncbi:anti-CBASS protein Acb1 family protein [Rhizobium leguminosarum]